MKAIFITSSILILLLAALRPVLRGRFRPQMQYALWLIVAVRLLVPLEAAPSAFSALALVNRAEKRTHLAQSITQIPIPVRSYQSAHDQALREYEERGEPITHIDPAEVVNNRTRELMEGPTLSELFQRYALPVWLGGAAVMALWFLLVNLRLRRKLRRAMPVEADCPLAVYVTPELSSPCLCGAFRPAVYITPAALADPDRVRHVLVHELTHYRHRDHWWAWVRCACLCLYWFDPLVWWAAALSRQDCELACDAGAIRRLGEQERLPYGRTLVAMIAEGRSSLLQTATTMAGGKRRIRERVELIARRPKTAIALALAAALLVGAAVGCTFTAAPEDAASQDPAPLSSDLLTADTLRSRLLNIPEELSSTVKAGASETKPGLNDIAVVGYWLDVPAEWESEQLAWLLDVYRVEKIGIGPNSGLPSSGDRVAEIIAEDTECRYIIERPADMRFQMEDSESFTTAFEAIRSYALHTVLDTVGVEPYSPDAAKQPLDTLQERLLDVPEDLRNKVSSSAAMGGEVSCLASYWLSSPKWADQQGGWLLDMYRMDEAQIQDRLDNGLWPAGNIFARDSGQYYAIVWAGDGRYQDSEEYWNAVNTVKDHVREAVLETEGVEPFDPYVTPPHFFSNIAKKPLEPGSYAIDGLSYTPVTSYPEDPEQWYLTGWLADVPLWMFSRNRGEETMFQVDGHLTQVFPYRAETNCYGGGLIPDGRAPQLMPLDGFGWGPKGTFGPFAVITHIFQGGTDQQYQLTVYDLDTDPVASYVHDWNALIKDFNTKCTVQVHPDRRSVSLSYAGQTIENQFAADDELWPEIQENGFAAKISEYCFLYSFNSDGSADLIVPIDGAMPYSACWTIRFTGSGFETVDFQFQDTDAVFR